MAIKIGIIGYGAMGAAIAEGLKTKYQVLVFDKDAAKTSKCTILTVLPTLEELLAQATTLIIAVKPQDIDRVLIKAAQVQAHQLIVSICAGIPTAYIEKQLAKAHVIRVMPNLAITANAGMTCLCKGAYSTAVDLSFVQGLFSKLGKTMVVEEDRMNAVTAVSGSGPGFLFALLKDKPRQQWEQFISEEFVPGLVKAAEGVGFSATGAAVLAEVTASGSMSLIEKTRTSPDILCVRVTSRGGTTEAGLAVLKGDIQNLSAAVEAARDRAEELSKQ